MKCDETDDGDDELMDRNSEASEASDCHSHAKNNHITNSTNVVRYMDSFDDQTFLEQVAYLSSIDILIAPHGAQLTGLAFLTHCGGVLEVFPKGYYVPHFYGSLARSSGHTYYSLYTGSVRNRTAELQDYMSRLERRDETRRFNITAEPTLVVEAVRELAIQWQRCRVSKDVLESGSKW